MKPLKQNRFLLSALIFVGLATPSAFAATYYWDNNGSTAGFGTAAGTWAAPTTGSATQGWSTSTTGVTLPGSITTLSTDAANDAVNFGNGATGLAAGTITVSSTVQAGNITFASGSGAIVLSGGTINLPATQTTTVNNAASTIASNLTGAATTLTKSGNGTLYLSGTNTLNGNIAVTGGVLVQNSAGALGGTNGVTISGNAILGLTSNFTRPQAASGTIAAANSIYFNSNGGLAAYGADRTVNFGGANATQTWFNGKNMFLGAADSTHKVIITNPISITTVTRPLQVNDGLAAIDGEFSGVISHNAGAFAGVDQTGTGTVAFTGDSTFFGSLVTRSGTIVVNKVTNSGTASPIGQGTSGFTLAGGTFRYAQVNGTGGGASTVNRTFGIAASSSLDASGTGALVLNNTGTISPDVTGQTGTWAASGSANVTALASTANLAIGMRATGTGIPAGAVITQILSSSSVTLSANTTAAGTAALITFGYPTARTLTLTGSNTDGNAIAGILQDSSSISAGILSIAKTGLGSWTLSGANTFTGNITVSAGTLIGAGATNSPGISAFGSRSNTRAVTVNTGGTLQFNSGNILGSNHTATTAPTLIINSGGVVTNGSIATNNALNNVQLNGGTLTSTTGHTSSSPPNAPVYGAWNLNGSVTSTGTSTISTSDPTKGWIMLKVVGDKTTDFSVTSGTLTVSAPVVDNPTDGNIGSLSKSGAGAMVLSAANTYTGGTIVNGGTLLLSGAVDMPATGALQVNSGGTFSLADGTARTTSAASLSLADGARLTLDWNAGSVDTLVSTNAATTAGNVLISINALNSPSGSGLTLISSPSGGLGAANYLLLNNTSNSLAVSDTAVQITSGVATPLTNAYWLGGQISGALGTMAVSSASSSNWASDSAGTPAGGVVPGAASDVFFSATGASQQSNVVLGADMSFNSLTFNDPTPVTVGSGNTLTLNSSGTGAASAISANQNATITSGVALGANSTWTVASATSLTVGGGVSGGFSLSKAGTGSLILTGANTYSGGTTLDSSSGSVLATITQTSNGLGSGPVSIGSGSSVLLNDTSTTNTTNLPLIGNVFTGTGLLQLQFAAGTTGRNTYMPNVTGFGGTIQLSAAGSTGDKWNATALGTIAGSLIIDSGAQLYVPSGNTTFTGGITLSGTGNSENRGAIRIGNATAVVGGSITLASSSTISMENVASSLTGNISSGAVGTQILTLGGTGSAGGILSGIIGGGTDTLAVTTAVGGNYTLTGVNTYTGDTTLAASTTLTLGSAGKLGSGNYAGAISNAGTLAVNSSGTQTLSGNISGAGNLSVTTGTLNLTNDTNTITGVLIIGAGSILNLSSFSDYGVPSAMGSRPQASETNGAVNSGTSGIGLLFQGGTLQYTGSTPQSTNRMIRMLNSTANTIDASGTGTGTLTFTGSVAQLNLFDTGGTRTLNLIGSNTGNNTFGIPLTNQSTFATSLVKSGVGKWLLTGASIHTGSTTINGGILDVNTIADSGTSALGIGGTLGLNSGTLSYSGASAATTARAVTLSANSSIDLPSGALTLSAGIAGNAFTLTKSSSGTLTLSGSADNSSLFLNVIGGVVQLDKSAGAARAVAGISGISSGATVRLTGAGGDQIYDGPFFIPTNGVSGLDGTLDLNGKNESTSNLNGSSSGVVDNTSGTACTFTVGNQNVSSTFSGTIQNTGASLSITKIGSGTLTLSGVSTYTGATTVNAGTLTLGSASALGTSAATVNNTGTLNLNGQTTINAVSVSNGGILTGSGAVGAATLAGSVTPGGSSSGLITMASATVAATSSVTLQLPATGTRGVDYDAITVSGPLALDGTITVSITGLTPTIGQSFDLIDSAGPTDVTNFNVATDLILPSLSGVGLAWDTSAFASSGIVSIINGDPYIGWAASKGLTGGNNAKIDDPDNDGRNNLYEFAFDGNPLSGANDGKIVGKIATVGADQVMTLTLPVRTGATFTANSGDQVSALIDALYYKIEGDVNLGTFANTISEVTPAITAGLPTLSTGWTYRTFRDAGTVPTVPKVFLRAKISDTP